jgi:nicotinamide-nucleotide amidase
VRVRGFLFYNHSVILAEVAEDNMIDIELFEIAQQLGNLLTSKNEKIAIAESCTGGWISQIITEVAGSSVWFDRGFVTYSNASKIEMLAVNSKTLDIYGAVSAETALEMVNGVLTHSSADCSVAVTGIAGPGGGTPQKPVGTVYIAWGYKNRETHVIKVNLSGDRHEIRRQVVKIALKGVILN